MTTLQNLIDFANKNDLNPRRCVLLLGELCGDGNIQHDYLYKMEKVEHVDVVNHQDEIDIVELGIVMRILPW